jgi:hypothetical protein
MAAGLLSAVRFGYRPRQDQPGSLASSPPLEGAEVTPSMLTAVASRYLWQTRDALIRKLDGLDVKRRAAGLWCCVRLRLVMPLAWW